MENNMTDEIKYQKALEFATEKHDGQFRKDGVPYIIHPIAVSEYIRDKGYGVDFQIAGLFHDLLEDTDATEEEILALSNEQVLEAVKLLTKQKGYVMSEYVEKIRANEIAFAVKESDRLHNLRCALVTDEEFKHKYVLETVDWYLDFSKEIRDAVKKLAKSMKNPITELSFLYEPVDSWKK